MTKDLKIIKDAFAAVPASVAVLSAEHGGMIHSMVVSTFTAGVSLTPALATVAIRKESRTWPQIAAASHIGVSLLGAEQTPVAGLLAQGGSHPVESDIFKISQRAPLVADAMMSFETKIHTQVELGDHIMIALELIAVYPRQSCREPLIYWQRGLTSLQISTALAT